MKKLFALIILSIVLISCGKTSDQDYFDQAVKSVEENKITEAVQNLETLLKEYPDTKLAPKALIQLATLYQNKMVPNVHFKESYGKSLELFKNIYEKYPQSEEAPKALFMSGFIYANDLMKFDQATKAYKLFLEIYPNDPLAVSAKEELDNMGIPPEEILKRKETAKK